MKSHKRLKHGFFFRNNGKTKQKRNQRNETKNKNTKLFFYSAKLKLLTDMLMVCLE